MNRDKLVSILKDCCNDVTFSFSNKRCGIFPTVKDYKPIYSVWYGDSQKNYTSVDDLMRDDFFGGLSLNDLVDKVDIQAY